MGKKTIAIIGAGQIGSRHLQSLSNLRTHCRIYVIDNHQAALTTARSRFDEVDNKKTLHKVYYYQDIASLPSHIDLAIVCTNSKERLGVMKTLLSNCSVKYLILEKVLFPQLEDYAAASRLLRRYKIRAWVDLLVRTWPIYQKLKNITPKQAPIELHTNGSNLDLGCNAVHYIDLLSYLSELNDYTIDLSKLDKETLPSKRKGYQEFTGIMNGQFTEGTKFSLVSYRQAGIAQTTTIISSNYKCLIFENIGRAYISTIDKPKWQPFLYNPPLLSWQSHLAVQSILAKGECLLPSYHEAVKVHLPLVKGLLAHLKLKESDICPIT